MSKPVWRRVKQKKCKVLSIKENLNSNVRDVIGEKGTTLANEIMKVVDKELKISSNDEYTFTFMKIAALSNQLMKMRDGEIDSDTKQLSSMMK